MPFDRNGEYVMPDGTGASSSAPPMEEPSAPLPRAAPVGTDVNVVELMNRIIDCWALAETRAKHLCAFETLGLRQPGATRKPTKEEVKKAWQQLCARLHPDRNAECTELATEAMRCINLAKQHLFEVHFGCALHAALCPKTLMCFSMTGACATLPI